VVLTVLEHLRNGKIEDAIACFAEEFSFKDHGVDLEFKSKERLAEFFRKARELYPDSLLQTDAIFVSGDRVIMEWTLQGNVTEPCYYAGASLPFPVSVRGVSIVLIDNGKVCRLVGLLRQTHLPALSLGFIFHGMGRTLNGTVPAAGAASREPSAERWGTEL